MSDLAVPPLFYAVARSGVILLAVAPWLLPVPKPAWRTVLVSILLGGGSFALLFIGLQTAIIALGPKVAMRYGGLLRSSSE